MEVIRQGGIVRRINFLRGLASKRDFGRATETKGSRKTSEGMFKGVAKSHPD